MATCTSGKCEKAGCPSCPSCNFCPEVGVRLIQAAPVPTPFYRELGTDYPSHPTELPGANYSNYDLFCLRTSLLPATRAVDAASEVSFLSYEQQGVMRLFVCLLSGGEFVGVSTEQAEMLKSAVARYVDKHQGYCLLLDGEDSIGSLPRAWLQSVLPFILPAAEVNSFTDDGALYVDLSQHISYSDVWTTLHLELEERLQLWYRQGVCVLHPLLNAPFIQAWRYRPLIEEPLGGEVSLADEVGLYRPDWTDERFAPVPYSFCLDRLSDQVFLTMEIGQSYPRRHSVALALSQANFFFSQRWVRYYARDLDEALTWSDIISSALTQLPERVEVINLNGRQPSDVTTDIKAKYPNSELVLYSTVEGDALSYTL